MAADRHSELFRAVYDTLVEPPPDALAWAELEARATEAAPLPVRRRVRWQPPPELRLVRLAAAAIAALVLIGGMALILTRGSEQTPPVITQPPVTTVLPTPSTTLPPPTTTPTTVAVTEGPMSWQRASVPGLLPIPTADIADFGSSMNRVVGGESGLVAVGVARYALIDPAAGDDAPGWVGAIWRSADGITWTRLPHDGTIFGNADVFYEITDVTVGGPGFVAVGYSLTREGYDLTSFADGVLFGGLTSDYQDAAVWVSNDGSAWTRVESSSLAGPGLQLATGVAAGEAGIVAVGQVADGGAIWISPDGFGWDLVEPAAFAKASIREVVADQRGFIAVGSIGIRPALWMSPEGLEWTEHLLEAVEPAGQVRAVTRVDQRLVAAGFVATDLGWNDRVGAIWVSDDEGSRWTQLPLLTSPDRKVALTGLGSTPGGLVAIGIVHDAADTDFGHAAVWFSRDGGASWSRVADPASVFGLQDTQWGGARDIVALTDRIVAVGDLGNDAAAWFGEWTD